LSLTLEQIAEDQRENYLREGVLNIVWKMNALSQALGALDYMAMPRRDSVLSAEALAQRNTLLKLNREFITLMIDEQMSRLNGTTEQFMQFKMGLLPLDEVLERSKDE
jgi:hypothetical protein